MKWHFHVFTSAQYNGKCPFRAVLCLQKIVISSHFSLPSSVHRFNLHAYRGTAEIIYVLYPLAFLFWLTPPSITNGCRQKIVNYIQFDSVCMSSERGIGWIFVCGLRTNANRESDLLGGNLEFISGWINHHTVYLKKKSCFRGLPQMAPKPESRLWISIHLIAGLSTCSATLLEAAKVERYSTWNWDSDFGSFNTETIIF